MDIDDGLSIGQKADGKRVEVGTEGVLDPAREEVARTQRLPARAENMVDRFLGECQDLVRARKRDGADPLGPDNGLAVTTRVMCAANMVDSSPEPTVIFENGLVDDESIDDLVFVTHEDVEVIGRKELDEKVEVSNGGRVQAGAREDTSVASRLKKKMVSRWQHELSWSKSHTSKIEPDNSSIAASFDHIDHKSDSPVVMDSQWFRSSSKRKFGVGREVGRRGDRLTLQSRCFRRKRYPSLQRRAPLRGDTTA